jgi:hypothetical protein
VLDLKHDADVGREVETFSVREGEKLVIVEDTESVMETRRRLARLLERGRGWRDETRDLN